MDARDRPIWLDEAAKQQASKQLNAIRAAFAPYMDDYHRGEMIRGLQAILNGGTQEDFAANRATLRKRAGRRKRKQVV